MTPEYVSGFRLAAAKCHVIQQALDDAVTNLEAMPAHSEKSAVEFMSRFDHVLAFWLEPTSGVIHWRKIRGPDDIKEGVETISAIPVATATDADHWRDLLAGTVTPRRALMPRLVATNGAAIDSRS